MRPISGGQAGAKFSWCKQPNTNLRLIYKMLPCRSILEYLWTILIFVFGLVLFLNSGIFSQPWLDKGFLSIIHNILCFHAKKIRCHLHFRAFFKIYSLHDAKICKSLPSWWNETMFLITFPLLTTWLLHVNRVSLKCQLFTNNRGIVFGSAAMHFWHYPVDLEKGGPSSEHMKPPNIKLWNVITEIGIREVFASQQQYCMNDVVPNKPESVMETFYVFPNQKQNWKLSFVFCLRVVIWLGIITWLFCAAILSSYMRLCFYLYGLPLLEL